jgi:ParB-like chromosome segregation protein Spo0J
MQIQHWAISKFVRYRHNLRKNDHVVDRMVASINQFGFKIPILVRSGGEIIDGHLRLKAAQTMALGEVPVILCDEWSAAQVKAFRLIVNRSASWADWDTDLVKLELEDLKSLDFDLSLTGFDAREIDNFLFDDADVSSEDAIPEPPEEPFPRTAIFGFSVRTGCCAAMPHQ